MRRLIAKSDVPLYNQIVPIYQKLSQLNSHPHNLGALVQLIHAGINLLDDNKKEVKEVLKAGDTLHYLQGTDTTLYKDFSDIMKYFDEVRQSTQLQQMQAEYAAYRLMDVFNALMYCLHHAQHLREDKK
jgi:PDZ domain-containing secreted protein